MCLVHANIRPDILNTSSLIFEDVVDCERNDSNYEPVLNVRSIFSRVVCHGKTKTSGCVHNEATASGTWQ